MSRRRQCGGGSKVNGIMPGMAWAALGAAGLLMGAVAGCYSPHPVRVAESAAHSPEATPVLKWIEQHAIRIATYEPTVRKIGDLFDGAWVIGLGEATHGQYQTLDFKRIQTMHAITQRGCRVVAYEASAASAMACDDYIAGRSNDLAAAMKGFGMLIWQVIENERLLNDLRSWNQRARPADRVRFIGIDIQDPAAATARLREVLPPSHLGLADAAVALVERGNGAAEALFNGDPVPMGALRADLDRWGESLEAVEGLEAAAAVRRTLCRMEIQGGLTMVRSGGARDRAMASMLLAQMQGVSASHPMVLWAHNAHIMHAPIRYLGPAAASELAMGGHLREALGDRYVAVGFAFGRGEFGALDRRGDAWEFRVYTVGEPRSESLEAMLDGVGPNGYVLDLRRGVEGRRVSPRVKEWLESGHGQRWFGGYNVHIDDSLPLLQTFPRDDFDVLVYQPDSSASRPVFGK